MNFHFLLDEFRRRNSRDRREKFGSLSLSLTLTCRIRKIEWEEWDIFPKAFHLSLSEWITSRHVSATGPGPFCPKTIYFVPVQVQFILNELYLI